MFNSISATLKLLLSGYYQNSILQQRDLIETVFLLDYFSGDTALISRWRGADEKTLREEFSPVAVRKKLDERDQYTGKKRAELYKLFSTLAGHPNPRGFDMLKVSSGDHHCGPFFDEKSLLATISDLERAPLRLEGRLARSFPVVAKQACRQN